jgi:hypothetical protein
MAVLMAVMLSVAAALPGPGARHLPPRLPASVVPRLGPRPCAEGPFAEGVFCALRLRGGVDAAAQVCPPGHTASPCAVDYVFKSDMQLRIRGSEVGAQKCRVSQLSRKPCGIARGKR